MITEKSYMVLLDEENAVAAPHAISVAISCYRYGREATEALDSLLQQTEPVFNVVVVDDCSTDDSIQVLLSWFSRQHYRHKFARVLFVQHLGNEGLSNTRNTALSLVDTPYTFILDADNMIYPHALERLRSALENSGAAMAYSLIERFGAEQSIVNNEIWSPELLSDGPYIDAMAMLRTAVVQELGGYRVMPAKFGWEDYDLWCSLVDHGYVGCHVPQILCRYRVHAKSMTAVTTRLFIGDRLKIVKEDLQAHHRMPFRFSV